ncbi:MAG TPA: glycosyltransferase 87 family protein [Gaiellaceae bacterium]
MNASQERWSLRADARPALLAGLVALAVFGGVWALLHHGFYKRGQIVDTPVYQRYGEAMVNGQVPYLDFSVEYPPAALPVFLLPAIGDHHDANTYRWNFEALMVVCGLLAIVGMTIALGALRAGPERLVAALAFAALAPLALGSVILTRFDLWPTALLVLGLAAVLAERRRLGLGVLGLAASAKIFPAVVVPLALTYVWRRRGRREALVCAGIFAAVVALCFAPFVRLAPGGVWDSLYRQADRPLQIESLGSSFLLVAHQLGAWTVHLNLSHGSQNQGGSFAGVLAGVESVLQAVAVIGLWIAFARGRAEPERLVRYSAAAVAAFIAFGKVLSPQFLIWLIPLVPLVRGRRGLAASAVLLVALVLTQLWFPYRYWRLALQQDAISSWLVFARDLVLVLLVFVLAMPRRALARTT